MITQKGAAKALLKRSAIEVKPITLNTNFPAQNSFVEDTARFIVAQCSRRAGKSNGLAIRFFKTMQRYPKSQCVYLGLTLDSARDIMWPILQELNDRYHLGCTLVESRLTVVHPNGAKLKLLGADMKNFIKRLKGRKYPGVAVDEAQDFGSHLQSLIDDVLTPSIADYEDGWLALTGTPGPVPKGYFFDITEKRRFGYNIHKWTLLENPHMPKPDEFIADLKVKREWDDNNPTLLREWRNKWILDVQSLWIRYKENLNDYISLPSIKGKKYNYILGIDVGFKDADALAVLAYNVDDTPTTYLVEEKVTSKQGLTELVEQIKEIQAKYQISKIVMDEGGLGKKMAEEMRRRHSLPIYPADKARKQENVEFLNDSLRLGKFKAKANSKFAEDSYLVQIDWDKSTPDKIVVKKDPHSDIIDAVLYAYKESPSYAFQAAPAAGPEYGSKEWNDKEAKEMFEKELENLKKQQENKEYYGY